MRTSSGLCALQGTCREWNTRFSRIPSYHLPCAELENGPIWLNEPSPLLVGRSRIGALGRLASTFGPRVHLTGHGGDHVFSGPPTGYRDLLWHRPFTAWRGLRGFGALGGW